jgi:hypothetical protein
MVKSVTWNSFVQSTANFQRWKRFSSHFSLKNVTKIEILKKMLRGFQWFFRWFMFHAVIWIDCVGFQSRRFGEEMTALKLSCWISCFKLVSNWSCDVVFLKSKRSFELPETIWNQMEKVSPPRLCDRCQLFFVLLFFVCTITSFL